MTIAGGAVSRHPLRARLIRRVMTSNEAGDQIGMADVDPLVDDRNRHRKGTGAEPPRVDNPDVDSRQALLHVFWRCH